MLLNFDMETRRINEIIQAGAGTRMADISFLEKEIDAFLNSKDRLHMLQGALYYDYEQEILKKKRLVIGEGGELEEDKQLTNYKLTDNKYSEMVDQKVNYLLSNPPTFSSEDTEYVDKLKEIFNRKFLRLLKNVGKDSYNAGKGWIYINYDELGELKFKRFNPWEILPFWKDDDHTELESFARIYDIEGYEGQIKKTFTKVEYYDTEGIHYFDLKSGKLIPEYKLNYLEAVDENGNMTPYNWKKVPLVAFKANGYESSLLKKCKCLQDALNEILSSFMDGMIENASGNTIIVIKNYAGENLGTFRKNLAQYKAVKVTSNDRGDGGIDKLEIEVNAENYKIIISELRKAIVSNCKGFDEDELKASGSPNEMTIKSVYSKIDLDANEIESEYQASFEELMWFIDSHIAGFKGPVDHKPVSIVFNRDMLVNEAEVIANCRDSDGVISRETIIAKHPWVNDVDLEISRLKEDRESETPYHNEFNQPGAGDA
ncbi:MAG: phage portal protein [Clostridiales bacterium]|nr:phage portal protein [Clostridiales bacterium]